MHNYIEKKIREDLFLSLSLSQLGKHDYCGNSFTNSLLGTGPLVCGRSYYIWTGKHRQEACPWWSEFCSQFLVPTEQRTAALYPCCEFFPQIFVIFYLGSRGLNYAYTWLWALHTHIIIHLIFQVGIIISTLYIGFQKAE